jgi:hypothetical protein
MYVILITCLVSTIHYVQLLLIQPLLGGDIHANPVHPQHLELCHINAHSIMATDGEGDHFKRTEIESILWNRLKYDVIYISKIWLDRTIDNCHLIVCNCDLCRKDRNIYTG